MDARLQHQRSKPRPGFYDRPIKGMSVTLLVIGCICIGVGVASMVISLTSWCTYREEDYYYYHSTHAPRYNHYKCDYFWSRIGAGVWSGFMYLASGIIGVLSAKRKTTCFIVAVMVLSIVTAWVALGSVTISIASNFERRWNQVNSYPLALYIMNPCVALLSLAAFVISWVKFGYTCRAVCCNGNKGLPTIKQRQHYQPLPSPPMMYATNQAMMSPQESAPVVQAPVAQPAPEPIYLVQGHQIIGMLPVNPQQMQATMGNTIAQNAVPMATPTAQA